MNGCCGPLGMVAKVLLLVGGLNWGLVGLQMLFAAGGDWNVVHLLLGAWPVAEGIVYLLVGLAALWKVVKLSTGGCCAK